MSSNSLSVDTVFDNKSKEEVIKEISQIRKNIKHKHRSMKREMLDSEEMWEKQLKPIAEPLKKIVEDGEKLQQQQLKEEIFENSNNTRKRKGESEDFETPVKRYIRAPPQGVKRKQNLTEEHDENVLPISKRFAIPDFNMDQQDDVNDNYETMDVNPEDVEEDMMVEETYVSPAVVTGKDLLKTPQGKDLARNYILREFKGRLAKEFFLKLLKGGKEVDHNYGIRVEGNQWMIGDKPLEIDIDDFIINGKRYEGTRGLYELLFMNIPSPYVYSEEDLDSYAMILRDTNAHKINYSPRGKVKSNRGNKYKNIISLIAARENEISNEMSTYSDLVKETVSGSGILFTDAKPNFIYYDDPNELVDRLRILNTSQEIGHTGHQNEINSIIEELKELDEKSIMLTGKSIVD